MLFRSYSEDVDWCLRARATGVPLVVLPEELADHVGGASTQQDGAWAYWWSRSRIRLLRKHDRGNPTRTAIRQLGATGRDLLRDHDAAKALARVRGTVSGLRA